MKHIYKKGDKKKHVFEVKEKDVAHFEEEAVHDVCATFTLAREIEWATRLFVRDMLEPGEEGIGTHLNIEHVSPALLDQEVEVVAIFAEIVSGEIICDFLATVGDRLVARGTTGQKILPKVKLEKIFGQLSN